MVTSKLLGAGGALVVEAIELRNWLLCFRCASEKFRVVVARLSDCMANSSPPFAAYRALMACCLATLNKSPGVHPIGIGETLGWDLAKLVMRAAGDQAKTACGNLQLCTGLEVGIEGATHSVGQRRLVRVRERREEEEEAEDVEDEDEEEVTVGIASKLVNSNIETARTEEVAA